MKRDAGAVSIRPYRASDREALGRVCVLTGDSGGDATGRFQSDLLLPAVYAFPYLDYAPHLAWVVESEGGPAGYILGVADVASFSRWWEEEWLGVLHQMFPRAETWPEADRTLLARAKNPQALVHEDAGAFPAEFHIDLLPEVQRRGLGRELVQRFAKEVCDRGASGIAIGVGAANLGARKFYERMGFDALGQEVSETGEIVAYRLGKTLDRDCEAGTGHGAPGEVP